MVQVLLDNADRGCGREVEGTQLTCIGEDGDLLLVNELIANEVSAGLDAQ